MTGIGVVNEKSGFLQFLNTAKPETNGASTNITKKIYTGDFGT